MSESTETVEADESEFFESPPASPVDIQAKAKALVRLLSAYERLDYKEVATENDMSVQQVCAALPGTFAQHLAQDFLATLLGSQNVGEFVINALETISALANTIVGMTSGIDETELHNVINAMADYSAAPANSAAEVLADQRVLASVSAVNESVLRVNKHLYAGFENEDSGFTNSAGFIVSSAFDEEEEDGDENEPGDDALSDGLVRNG